VKKIILIVFCLNILAACSTDKEINDIELDKEFVIAFNELKEIDSENMTIKFADIKESRCPDGPIACIWEGEAKVTFEVANESGTIVSIMGTLNCDSHLVSNGECTEKEISGYQFKLISVDPFPQHNVVVENSDYTVKLIVSKM